MSIYVRQHMYICYTACMRAKKTLQNHLKRRENTNTSFRLYKKNGERIKNKNTRKDVVNCLPPFRSSIGFRYFTRQHILFLSRSVFFFLVPFFCRFLSSSFSNNRLYKHADHEMRRYRLLNKQSAL